MSLVYSPALDLLYFEDLPLGGEWLSRRRTLTETDLALYRGLAGDLNPLHSDHEHAAQSAIGFSLPGPLVGAVAIGLGSIDVPVPATVALVGMTWKFTKPVHVGESIAARWRLNRKRDVENPRWGLVTWQIEVVGGDGDVKALGEVSRLVARREAIAVDGDGEQPAGKRRRRRRSSSAQAASAPAPAPEAPEPAPADTPPPSRRRRRGRRGGGGGNGHGDGGNGAAVEAASAEPASPASDSGISAERGMGPRPEREEIPTSAPSGEDAQPGIGGVLKRIRRRRT
jgi:acyl dehydratase